MCSVDRLVSNSEQKLCVFNGSTHFIWCLQFFALPVLTWLCWLTLTERSLILSFPKGLNAARKVTRQMSPRRVVIMMTFKEVNCRFFKRKENLSVKGIIHAGEGKLHCVGVCVTKHTKVLSLLALSRLFFKVHCSLFFSYITEMLWIHNTFHCTFQIFNDNRFYDSWTVRIVLSAVWVI